MEGFLQSLKFDSIDMQRHVCTLVGKATKFKGKKKKWWKKQELYWNGVTYKRDSEKYQQLLDRAYDALFENSGFMKALEASRRMTLTHSMGKSDRTKTVMTTSEFIGRLMRLRKKIEQGEALF